MAIFLANEINSTGEGHVQIMFPLKEKKCRVFEDIFSGT